ncbi:MAG: GNAT family N-acetyltransferase [Sphingomonas sp.]|uniref:GNAT family N-acetyltransferase n=1 Tax=Sphingomonas sp. TaxID=28214 RepID=UPI002600CF19|nr:GNAT family N-acetyltransferase [Sphingomonas sp.]MBX9860807.1 GNAT family N-acetyltransferase [Sphingomonas sp.]MBY0282920.1 GNAT family N-acetyltransferase [Sphingomonas sp.]
MALTRVAPGEIATIVTTLEMRRRPPARPLPDSPLRLVRWARPQPDKYRALFARVGAPWLWYSRLTLDDASLAAAIDRPETQVHAVIDRAGIEVGLLEFTHPAADWCALDYFGLVPELAGKGHGRWLMSLALAMMWRPGVALVRVNTCTLDHPSALNFYRAQGFESVMRTIETFPDPRASGLLPRDAAPQIPML